MKQRVRKKSEREPLPGDFAVAELSTVKRNNQISTETTTIKL